MIDSEIEALDEDLDFPDEALNPHFDMIYDILNLIKEDFPLFSDQEIKSYFLEKINQASQLQYSSSTPYHIRGEIQKGMDPIYKGLKDIIQNIVPYRNSKKNEFLSKLKTLMNSLNYKFFNFDTIVLLFKQITDLISKNVNHVRDPNVIQSLQTLNYLWLSDLGGGYGFTNPETLGGAVEKLNLLLLLATGKGDIEGWFWRYSDYHKSLSRR